MIKITKLLWEELQKLYLLHFPGHMWRYDSLYNAFRQCKIHMLINIWWSNDLHKDPISISIYEQTIWPLNQIMIGMKMIGFISQVRCEHDTHEIINWSNFWIWYLIFVASSTKPIRQERVAKEFHNGMTGTDTFVGRAYGRRNSKQKQQEGINETMATIKDATSSNLIPINQHNFSN